MKIEVLSIEYSSLQSVPDLKLVEILSKSRRGDMRLAEGEADEQDCDYYEHTRDRSHFSATSRNGPKRRDGPLAILSISPSFLSYV